MRSAISTASGRRKADHAPNQCWNGKDDETMELKGSKTEANLWTAFAGESMARNKYTFFASRARKEGYEQIAAIFEELGGIGDTAANLKSAAAGEHEEWTQMYKEMADTAREEGFEKLAFLFEGVGKIEKEHEERYLTLLNNLEEGVVFKRGDEYMWKCRNCGHIHFGKEAPEVCPVCAHPQAYFEIRAVNY